MIPKGGEGDELLVWLPRKWAKRMRHAMLLSESEVRLLLRSRGGAADAPSAAAAVRGLEGVSAGGSGGPPGMLLPGGSTASPPPEAKAPSVICGGESPVRRGPDRAVASTVVASTAAAAACL